MMMVWITKIALSRSTTKTWTKSDVITQQQKFLKHTACEHCGSSDAKALYADGSAFCFSCRKLTRSNVSGYVLKKQADENEVTVKPPDDIGYQYSAQALEWAAKYDLTAVDLIRNKVFFSPRYNQLLYIYPYMDRSGIGLIQGRNFTDGRTKYFNQGDVNQVLPIYHYTKPGDASMLVLVEDAISAIKISQNIWVDAMPILGSSLSLSKISRIAGMGYETVAVWLDHDKYKEAMRISDQVRYAGPNSFVVTTDLDPKCYSIDMIARKLDLLK